MATLKELRDVRIQKLQSLKDLGVDPYPAKSYKNIDNGKIKSDFESLEGKEVIVAGRAFSIRSHGKLAFIDIKDPSGKVQLYIKEENLQNADYQNSELKFSDLHLLDMGDFVEGKGIVTKTQRGEVSVEATQVRILTKSLRPLPDSWDGLKDKETRLRRRYLDTNINDDVFQRFVRRAKYWEAHREFFKSKGFLEINIPVLENVPGGADAKPFTTHMDAIDEDFYLRISQELYLKRLIGGGYTKVYEIGPRFRNEGFSNEHLPEHMAMEFYWAYADWEDGMKFIEEMFKYVAQKVWGTLQFEMRGFKVDLSKKWERIDYTQIIKERFGIDIFKTTLEEVNAILKENKSKPENNLNRGIDQLWKLIRKTIPGPAFMINEPKFLSTLAKSNPKNPELTERFHPLIAGSELGNAFSELNDPLDQYQRFLEQQQLRDSGDAEAQFMDIDFVEMLEYGMPPTFGYGHSERNFWFFENVTPTEGVPFPPMKHEIDEVTKNIYPEIFAKTDSSNEEEQFEQDFTKRMSIVVNSEVEDWQQANAISHVAAYLGNKLKDSFSTGKNFVTADGKNHPRNTQYPIIIQEAKAKDLNKFMDKVRESGLMYHGFIKEMIETTNDREIITLLKQKEDGQVEYLAIGIFGKDEQVKNLTKGFKLFS